MDEYQVRIPRLPEGIYLKDLLYVGVSVLREPLRLGSAIGNEPLRVVLDHGAASVEVRVADRDGPPVAGNVVLMPDEARDPATLSALRVFGPTDQEGRYQAQSLAPGKYFVLATEEYVDDLSPELLGWLLAARSRAAEVEIGRGETARITVRPVALQ